MSHDDTVVALSRHRPRHERRSLPARDDPLSSIADALSRPALESLQRTLASVSGLLDDALAASGAGGPSGRHEHDHEHGRGSRHRHPHERGHHEGRGRGSHDCGCGRGHDDCGCTDTRDDCHCSCCVGDVDLAVYARVGETRLVPIAIENPRKREQHVQLQLSEFRTRGGGTDVTVSAQLDREDLTVAPCTTEAVLLRVHAAGRSNDEREERDVDDCTTYVADLRLEGCDVRPIRIGLVLLPRDCASYEVSCRCTCC